MDDEQARSCIAAIRAADDTVFDTGELDQLWAVLDSVRPEAILGTWKGRVVATGHRMESMLAQVNWYGKTFHSPSRVEPLICQDEHGARYSNTELSKGEASLWMVEFRGETTATMVYDGLPILDHFKRIDGDTLLGVMNGKDVLDEGRHFYFLLERA